MPAVWREKRLWPGFWEHLRSHCEADAGPLIERFELPPESCVRLCALRIVSVQIEFQGMRYWWSGRVSSRLPLFHDAVHYLCEKTAT